MKSTELLEISYTAPSVLTDIVPALAEEVEFAYNQPFDGDKSLLDMNLALIDPDDTMVKDEQVWFSHPNDNWEAPVLKLSLKLKGVSGASFHGLGRDDLNALIHAKHIDLVQVISSAVPQDQMVYVLTGPVLMMPDNSPHAFMDYYVTWEGASVE